MNSYKRLVRQGAMNYFSWAPVFNSYGSNNRTNSVRVPAGLEGIRDKIDPREPNEDNLYAISEQERQARGIDFLPQNLLEAVEAFDSDPFVEATLGKALKDEFVKYKLQEWNHYHLHVSQWEIERYSTIF